jgi:hypothetical protein
MKKARAEQPAAWHRVWAGETPGRERDWAARIAAYKVGEPAGVLFDATARNDQNE